MDNTIKVLLGIMNLPEYTHIVVKYREPGLGLMGLGGGSPASVLSRFGDYVIDWSYVLDGIYFIVVKNN